MKCPKCGNILEDINSPCPNCGKKMTEREIKIEKMLAKRSKEQDKKKKYQFFRDVGNAYKDFWLKIFDIKSLSSVKDFWYAIAINAIIQILAAVIYVWVGVVIAICLVIPTITCVIRRIKDSGREWFYFLLVLLPGAGVVVMMVLLSLPSYYRVVDESKPAKKSNKKQSKE